MNKVDTALAFIDHALSEKVEYISPFTFGLDLLTNKAHRMSEKRFIQIFTYASRPLDTLVQIVVTPILALYQTLKGIVISLKDGHAAEALGKVVLSPYTLAYKMVRDWVAVAVWGVMNLVPVRTLADIKDPIRSLTRLKTLEDENSFVYGRGRVSEEQAEAVRRHLSIGFTLKMIDLMDIRQEHPHSMALSDVFDYTQKPGDCLGGFVYKLSEYIARHAFLKPNVLVSM